MRRPAGVLDAVSEDTRRPRRQPRVTPPSAGASAFFPRLVPRASSLCRPLPRRVYNALMPGNSFGERFRVTTAGVSHGPGYVVIIDGCPPGLPLCVDDLLPDLQRRRPGQSK